MTDEGVREAGLQAG